MRTNIVIDDSLMRTVIKKRGFKSKKDAVEFGLKLILQLDSQKRIRNFRGKLKWEGSLTDLRGENK